MKGAIEMQYGSNFLPSCSRKDDLGREREREGRAQRGLYFWIVALKFVHMETRLSIIGFLSVV